MDAINAIIVQCLPIIVATVGPILTAAAKKLVPDIPKVLIPLTSAALGTIVAILAGFDYGDSVALGAAGSAIREIVDQIKKSIDTDPTV